MSTTKRFAGLFVFALLFMCLSGCSSAPNQPPFEERMRAEYAKNGRLDKFYELKKNYDSRVVLYLNREEDRAWIINFTGWFASIFIDLPEIAGTGALLATFYITAWAMGVTLTGGGILAVLAVLGGALGGIPGIAPAIMGIIYLAIVFSIASSLMASVWS